MLSQLFTSAMHSTPAGFVGVTLIFAYFCLIVKTAFMRVRKGDHMHH